MASHNIYLMNAQYPAVPAVVLPTYNDDEDWATYTCVDDTTAAASDVATGKYFYTANGVRTAGTNSGGGGNALVQLAYKDLGTISTSSTSATDTGQTLVVEGFDAYDLLVAVCHTNPHTNNRHIATVRIINLSGTSNSSTKTGTQVATSTQHWKLSSSGTYVQRSGTTPYGVYVNAATLSTTDGRKITMTIFQRYNSTSTGTINGHYYIYVYGLKLKDLL